MTVLFTSRIHQMLKRNLMKRGDERILEFTVADAVKKAHYICCPLMYDGMFKLVLTYTLKLKKTRNAFIHQTRIVKIKTHGYNVALWITRKQRLLLVVGVSRNFTPEIGYKSLKLKNYRRSRNLQVLP